MTDPTPRTSPTPDRNQTPPGREPDPCATPPATATDRLDLVAHLRHRIAHEGPTRVANPAIMRRTLDAFLNHPDSRSRK